MKNSRFSYKYRGSQCLNCDALLDKSDRFCHYCGQLNSTKKLSFKDFASELFGGLFAYDSRVYKTLRKLLFSPGRLSKEYVSGKRNTYVNPFRFFLSLALIIFILYGIKLSYQNETENAFKDIITSTESECTSIENFKNSTAYYSEEELEKLSFLNSSSKRIGIYNEYYKIKKEPSSLVALEELNHTHTRLNSYYYKKTLQVKEVMKDPSSFISYMVSKLPFIIFCFIPISALFVWLSFGRTSYNYMEHLVFTFNNQSFFFFTYAIALTIKDITGFSSIYFLLFIVYNIHFYLALKRFYEQKTWKTIVKFVFLNTIFITLALFATIISFFGTFAIY
jgi:hypothetical protein